MVCTHIFALDIGFYFLFVYNYLMLFQRRQWHPTSVFLPGEFHGQRSLAGYRPWNCKESDTIGEGDGTPLQHSCLANPMDGGAWWAAVHGVAKSQT